MPAPRHLLSSRSDRNFFRSWLLLLFLLPLSSPSGKEWAHWGVRQEEVCPSARAWAAKPGSFCTTLWASPFLANQTELEKRERRAIQTYCELDSILDRFDCGQEYSVNVQRGQCHLCRQAYREWVCAMVTDTLEDGQLDCQTRLMPCPSCASICHQVMRLCPYLSPDRMQFDSTGQNLPHVSQYGGHPAFYCPLENDNPSDPAYTSLTCFTSDPEGADGVHNTCTNPPSPRGKRTKRVQQAQNSNPPQPYDYTDPEWSQEVPYYTSCCWTYASSVVHIVHAQDFPRYGSDEYFYYLLNSTLKQLPKTPRLPPEDNKVIINCCNHKGTCAPRNDSLDLLQDEPEPELQAGTGTKQPEKEKAKPSSRKSRSEAANEVDIEEEKVLVEGSGSDSPNPDLLPPLFFKTIVESPNPTHISELDIDYDEHYLDTEPDESREEAELLDLTFSDNLLKNFTQNATIPREQQKEKEKAKVKLPGPVFRKNVQNVQLKSLREDFLSIVIGGGAERSLLPSESKTSESGESERTKEGEEEGSFTFVGGAGVSTVKQQKIKEIAIAPTFTPSKGSPSSSSAGPESLRLTYYYARPEEESKSSSSSRPVLFLNFGESCLISVFIWHFHCVFSPIFDWIWTKTNFLSKKSSCVHLPDEKEEGEKKRKKVGLEKARLVKVDPLLLPNSRRCKLSRLLLSRLTRLIRRRNCRLKLRLFKKFKNASVQSSLGEGSPLLFHSLLLDRIIKEHINITFTLATQDLSVGLSRGRGESDDNNCRQFQCSGERGRLRLRAVLQLSVIFRRRNVKFKFLSDSPRESWIFYCVPPPLLSLLLPFLPGNESPIHHLDSAKVICFLHDVRWLLIRDSNPNFHPSSQNPRELPKPKLLPFFFSIPEPRLRSITITTGTLTLLDNKLLMVQLRLLLLTCPFPIRTCWYRRFRRLWRANRSTKFHSGSVVLMENTFLIILVHSLTFQDGFCPKRRRKSRLPWVRIRIEDSHFPSNLSHNFVTTTTTTNIKIIIINNKTNYYSKLLLILSKKEGEERQSKKLKKSWRESLNVVRACARESLAAGLSPRTFPFPLLVKGLRCSPYAGFQIPLITTTL